MKKAIILAALLSGACEPMSDTVDSRQTRQQAASLDAADRQIGMPRIVHFTQRKLLKNAYEDMDQTILTWVYTQGLDGRFVCIGQALGYGVPGGTQFTAGHRPSGNTETWGNESILMDQAEPNGLFVPGSADATIVDLIDPATGIAHTALIEPKVVTLPFKMPAQAVSVQCPASIDPAKVTDAKEKSTHEQRD